MCGMQWYAIDCAGNRGGERYPEGYKPVGVVYRMPPILDGRLMWVRRYDVMIPDGMRFFRYHGEVFVAVGGVYIIGIVYRYWLGGMDFDKTPAGFLILVKEKGSQ